jgi:3-phenylpropionate/trans-cinnamate dioxygenase ferredoxin subunit
MTWRIPWLPTANRDASAGENDDANEADAPEADVPEEQARWVDVGGLADLHDNRMVVEMNGTSVLVVRTGRALAAIENECPHLGQRLSDGEVRGRVIQCAAHGYRWDLATGRPVQGLRVQRRRPLREVPVRLAGDRIMLACEEGRT